MKRSWVVTMISLICMATLTGCWDRNEVKDLALVMGTGIDKAHGGGVRLTVQVAIPSGVKSGSGTGGGVNAGQGKSYVIVSANGRDIKDADHQIQAQLPRKLYTAHRRVLVIGEEKAKEGVSDVLDQFSRDPENRLRNLIVVAKHATAEEILTMPTVVEKIPGEEIKKLEDQEIGASATMLEFLKATASYGKDPVADAVENISNAQTEGSQTFSLSDTAVFNRFKLVGYLNSQEARGLKWIEGGVRRAYITAYVQEGNGNVTFYLTSAKRKIKPVISSGKVHFQVAISGKGEILENDTSLDLTNPANMKIVKKLLDKAVASYTKSAFDKAKEFDADVFGFGDMLWRSHPAYWTSIEKRWHQVFLDSALDLTVDIQPLRSGASASPLQLRDEEVKE